jgi:uncharacterized membrane protein
MQQEIGDNSAMNTPRTDGRTTSPRRPHFLRYLVIGLLTVAPLWITWLVLDFLFSLLARVGAPFLWGASRVVRPFSETLAGWLADPSVQYVLAASFALTGLYLVGLFASFVVGRSLIEWLERLLGRLPLVQTIYGGTKRFLQSLTAPPAAGQRVVLVTFPCPPLKAVGFVTRVMREETSGRELAAVYVPTSPNPTSGYIEIVPIEELVQTDWTLEQAMSFVVTGGAQAPDRVPFAHPPRPVREG